MSVTSNAGRIGVWGRSGSGKSSYVKQRLAGRRRVVVFDPMQEYGAALGCQTVVHNRRDAIDQVRQAMAADWRGFRVAYVPPAGSEAAALSALSGLLMKAQEPFKEGRGGATLTLVVEEMNLAFPVHGGDAKCPGFAELCSRGRHYGIEVIGASQRIAEVATRFRGNCTETVVLAQKGPRDLQAAAAELGVTVDRVSALGNLQYLHEVGGSVSAGAVTFGASNANKAPRRKKRG